MDNNKNTFIAIGLMLVVWMAFTVLFPPTQTQPPVDQQSTQKEEPVDVTQQPVIAPVPVTATTRSTAAVIPVLPIDEQELTIRTDLFTAVFTNIGARLKYFELNNYRVDNSDDSDLVSLVDVNNPSFATLRVSGINGLPISSEAPYTLPGDDHELTITGADTKTLTFSTSTPDGIILEKIFTIQGNSYAIDMDMRLSNSGSTVVQGSLELSLVQVLDNIKDDDQFSFTGGATFIDGEVVEASLDDLKTETPSFGKSAVWSAYENKYFMSALVPLAGASEKVRIQRQDGRVENVFNLPFVSLNPETAISHSFMAYFGPRDKRILEEVNYELSRAVDFGFFSPIAEPLLWFMNIVNTYVHNYGIAIILVTVLIKLLFWPLTHKSYASMKAMQKLQPEIQKLKERYKNDRSRQGQETMALYKENRVNPMSGCLPMLIQIPVFFALYRVLYGAIELRHADFAFWITDLSAKDPYYITPLVMGATMFIQQKMTPSTMDAMQQKIFLMMPVVFTVMFLNFPSGLVLYWLINNLLTIAQQYYIHRKFA